MANRIDYISNLDQSNSSYERDISQHSEREIGRVEQIAGRVVQYVPYLLANPIRGLESVGRFFFNQSVNTSFYHHVSTLVRHTFLPEGVERQFEPALTTALTNDNLEAVREILKHVRIRCLSYNLVRELLIFVSKEGDSQTLQRILLVRQDLNGDDFKDALSATDCGANTVTTLELLLNAAPDSSIRKWLGISDTAEAFGDIALEGVERIIKILNDRNIPIREDIYSLIWRVKLIDASEKNETKTVMELLASKPIEKRDQIAIFKGLLATSDINTAKALMNGFDKNYPRIKYHGYPRNLDYILKTHYSNGNVDIVKFLLETENFSEEIIDIAKSYGDSQVFCLNKLI